MQEKSLVSVIIPVFNSETTIATAISSVLSQTYDNLEVIVVDDGSEDTSLEVVNSFADKRVKTFSQANAGACAARNLGLRKAQGRWIQFLDADDQINPCKIATQVEKLQTKPDAFVASCPWAHFDFDQDDAKFIQSKIWQNYNQAIEWLLDAWTNGLMMQTACWLTPRRVIHLAGTWDESLTKNQDGEFFCRVLLNSSGVCFVPDAYVFYRRPTIQNISQKTGHIHSESLLRSYESYEKEILQFEESDRVKEALVRNYLGFIYQTYPHFPTLLKQAKEHVERLGVCQNSNNIGGARFRLINSILGFEPALKVRRTIDLTLRKLSTLSNYIRIF